MLFWNKLCYSVDSYQLVYPLNKIKCHKKIQLIKRLNNNKEEEELNNKKKDYFNKN